LLVSGSRDHLVQLYDSNNDYEPVQIIEEHQGTITSVKFIEEKQQGKQMLSLISSGADK
jgi:WD40 repeat protein